ncbi:chymotrypsin-like elastase family member 2A [Pararge aegeria]|uniref:Jg24167 protein n=1 Tax=Pararge aegeria aegeria TaxID=348720 RepID=A0A8S4S3F4_9NEOP|nr:chymotrypsin-like elastase family member 2A [Pararge aegeria]XP_039748270.1 chymotrypsin-like elastase family member 2A [Pararge aegeria]XP_039748271.1 chymotrypsin-like elastase family member 2A [Pararge aegeria]CAH2248588.1 jg24167 [Pararge aegeria aegeria]
MKQIVLFVCVALMTLESDSQVWMPVGSPILSAYPCKNTKDILVWFEPGLPSKDNNRYYVYINKNFPMDSVTRVFFDSEVNITFTVRSDQKKFQRYSLAGDSIELRFFVQHVGLGFTVKGPVPGLTPYITGLTINDVQYCDDPDVGFLHEYAAEAGNAPTDCGRQKVGHTELIVSGASTKPGDWPWHAALYTNRGTTSKYICGGTLITKNFVLTAAHCASSSGTSFSPEVLSVVLGKYNLKGGDRESEERKVHRIIIHEQYEYRKLSNDIALLKLRNEVPFTDYIQPACLWSRRSSELLRNATRSVSIMGTVVGWGFNSNDTLSETLKEASMPMVSESTCIRSNPLFYGKALTSKKFCAGHHNGTSACNGDSGGGFQVFIPDKVQAVRGRVTGSWHVRGIVSNTIARLDAPVCDPYEYVLFTDVDKYRDWIDSHLDD